MILLVNQTFCLEDFERLQNIDDKEILGLHRTSSAPNMNSGKIVSSVIA